MKFMKSTGMNRRNNVLSTTRTAFKIEEKRFPDEKSIRIAGREL